MLTKVVARNFKVFGKTPGLELSLSGFNLFLGENNSALTHPGVGALTALGTEVFLGDPNRFATGNQVGSYIGMIPSEHSSGKRQRLGKLSKEGNSLLRYWWAEATMHAVGKDPELKRFYRRKLIQKEMGKARIAAARKLTIRLWIMMRDQIDYEEFCRRGKLRQEGKAQRGDA